jgi:hypothetical protein
MVVMVVYAVIVFWWDSYEFVGVYSTREAAEAAGKAEVEESGWTYQIYETELQ